MKKVLFLIFTPNNSGAEIILRNLIQKNDKIISYALIDKKYEGKISENDFRTKYIQKLKRNSRSIISYLIKMVYLSVGLTISILKLQHKHNFDIIYANTLTMATYGILSNLIFKVIYPNVEFIWHDHNVHSFVNKSDLFAENICSSIYSKTIVVSNAVYNKSRRTKKKKFLLYNGVDSNIFKENNLVRNQIRTKFSVNNQFVIGIFGQIMEEKGHIGLLKAISDIDNKNLVTLFIIGEFYSKKIKQKIDNTIKDLRMQNVILIPFVNNINKYYNLIDILVNNTNSILSESFGLTIIEGMSSSKIVIAPQIGGPTEIIRNNIDGFLFKPDSVSELKKKINYVIKNFDKLNYIRQNARKNVLRKFTIEKMIVSFNKIIYNY